jgi:PST family polysaccharide transporter
MIKFSQRLVLTPNIKNISWHLIDKAIRLIFGLFVGAWVARYLGPDEFGTWNYALAVVSIAGTFAVLGIDNIVIRDAFAKPQTLPAQLGSAFLLRIIGTLFCWIISILTIYILDDADQFLLAAVSILSSAYFFQAFDVIDHYFQAHIKYKYTAFAKNIAFILIAGIKVTLILFSCPLIYFFWAYLIEFFLGSLFMIIFFQRLGNRILDWTWDWNIVKNYGREGWPLILTGFVIILHFRVDQIMLKSLSDDAEVGIYSAAVKLSEVWYIIPVAVMNTYFPGLIENFTNHKKRYWANIDFLFNSLFWFAILVAFLVIFLSPLIIWVIYGDQYVASSTVLAIHFFSGIGVFIGTIVSKHVILIKKNHITFVRTLVGVAVNIILNLLLIPNFGAVGAAWATLISFLLPSIFVDYIFLRDIFWIQLKALNPISAFKKIRNGMN